MRAAGEVTALLGELKGGRKDALDRLIPLVYGELRRLAAHYMRRERPGHTLQATALVHEAFLKLVDQNRADWQCRTQFMAVASQLMRRLLVDHSRAHASRNRNNAVTLDESKLVGGANISDAEAIIAVDEALASLEQLDPQQAHVLEMRYFGGLSVEETADALGISTRTVKRDSAMAKAWLQGRLESGDNRDG